MTIDLIYNELTGAYETRLVYAPSTSNHIEWLRNIRSIKAFLAENRETVNFSMSQKGRKAKCEKTNQNKV